MSHKSQQNLFIVPVLKFLGTKLPVHLLCTIRNTSPDGAILPKNWHMDEMKLLSTSDDSWHPPSVNEVTHDISCDHIDVQHPQTDSFPSTSCKICSNSWPIPETSVLMPSNLQIHWHVPLINAKILKETKLALYGWLQKHDAIISRNNNDIGQTDLIEMHIATRLDAAPVAAWSYPLALKYHDFLKQEFKNFLDAGNIPQRYVPMGKPHCSNEKKHTPEGLPQQFYLCIDYRKLNYLLLAVTPSMGTKKSNFSLCPSKNWWVFCFTKRSKVLYSTGPLQWLLPHQVGQRIHPQKWFHYSILAHSTF